MCARVCIEAASFSVVGQDGDRGLAICRFPTIRNSTNILQRIVRYKQRRAREKSQFTFKDNCFHPCHSFVAIPMNMEDYRRPFMENFDSLSAQVRVPRHDCVDVSETVPCCSDMISLHPLEEECCEASSAYYIPWILTNSHDWSVSSGTITQVGLYLDWMHARRCSSEPPFAFDDDLGRILRALIGAFSCLASIVLTYTGKHLAILLLSPLFVAYGCKHYDMAEFAMSCSVSEIESSAVMVRYTRPAYRVAFISYTLNAFLLRKMKHMELLVFAEVKFSRKSRYVHVELGRHSSHFQPGDEAWAKNSKRALVEREQLQKAQRKMLLYLHDICENPTLLVKNMLLKYLKRSHVYSMPISVLIVLASNLAGWIDGYNSYVATEDGQWEYRVGPRTRMSERMQLLYGVWPMLPHHAIGVDESFLYAWYSNRRLRTPSPSYSPTLPDYSMTPNLDNTDADTDTDAEVKQEQHQPEENEESVFQQQLALAIKLSKEEAKKQADGSETETDEEMIGAQSPTLDYAPGAVLPVMPEVIDLTCDENGYTAEYGISGPCHTCGVLAYLRDSLACKDCPSPRNPDARYLPRQDLERMQEAHFIQRQDMA